MNVLSLFDGMSCGQLALKQLGIKVDNYYASEIDVYAIAVTQHNFPKTIQLGDVRNVCAKNLPKIDLILAGSPCNDLSIAGTKKGMLGITSLTQYYKKKREKFDFGKSQSYLFWEFVRLVRELKPTYGFLLENVVLPKSLKHEEKLISKILGFEPININSSLITSQNRDRLYWTPIQGITIPEDKGILCTDVIPHCYGAGTRGVERKNRKPGQSKFEQRTTVRTDFKFNCLTTGSSTRKIFCDKTKQLRSMTTSEAELIQTVPIGYTNVPGISDTQRFNMLGKGWTIDVIKHILKPLKSKKVLKYHK